jgi:hypothetical protein
MQALMSRRMLAATGIVAMSLAVAGSALAATSGKGPSRAKIVIKGGDSFKPNAFFTNTLRFAPGTVPVRSGGTVTMTDLAAGEPHTLSIVKRSDVPRTASQVNNCTICAKIGVSHGVNPNGPPSPPSHPVVNAGAPGFNTPGDSIVIGPKGAPKVTFKVTAKPGTTLYFICALHPWMQGRFQVK